jgi:hypothetical protein
MGRPFAHREDRRRDGDQDQQEREPQSRRHLLEVFGSAAPELIPRKSRRM